MCQLTNNSSVLDEISAPKAALGDIAAVAEAHPLRGDSGCITSRDIDNVWGLAEGVELEFGVPVV